MKKNQILRFILAAFIMLLQYTSSHAQIKDVKWEPWMQHPCYKGLSVSVINMGWGKEAEGYLWGVRIKNNYDTKITFDFSLIVGGTEKLKGRAAYKLKPGEIWTDGADYFTANLFKSSSVAWTVEVGNVCFDGMRCGGDDDCYADCDVSARKVNQPCGLEAHTSTKKEKVQQKPQEQDEEEQTTQGDIKPGNYTVDDPEISGIVKVDKDDKSLTYSHGGTIITLPKISTGKYKHKNSSDGVTYAFTSILAERFAYTISDSNGVVLATQSYTYKDPSLKSENKPSPVTENKTASGDCKVTGKFLEKGQFFSETGELYIYAENQISNIHTITVECQGQNLSIFVESSSGERIEKSIATAIPPIQRSIVNNSKVLGTWKGKWHYQIKTYEYDNINGNSPYGLEVIFQLLENGNIVIAPPYDIAHPKNGQKGYILFTKIR